MFSLPSPWLALWLAAPLYSLAQKPGSIISAGNTQVSAMMLFVGNEEKVYILDKAEGNAAQVNGHSAWGAVWDVNTRQTELMDVATNVFCASGMHLPNGSFITLGGNGAVGPGGNIGSVLNPDTVSAAWDVHYQDYDGRKAIRLLEPCTGDITSQSQCQWFDNSSLLAMQKERWYSTAEPLGDGTIVIIGGFVNGGYVNRNTPNTDPTFEGGAAEPTYEFFPSKGPAQMMQFMTQTSGLNAYAEAFLMPSGLMFVQANLSTILWDPLQNVETPLPDMPNGVVRVYPASGAVAMLPLTPANNWTPTVLFCGGTDMPAEAYGNYSYPEIDTWNYVASRDCQRITPEPTDKSAPVYVQDDDMLEPRTMGQFIALPDGTLLVVNGGQNGTAGYADRTGNTPPDQKPFGQSLATAPAFTPAIYNPNAPAGKRWSNAGLDASTIPRLYHSSAILLPDASVLIAGSNPNVDVNLTTFYPTTYTAEIFYPPYYSASRPVPSGIPKTISYGGSYFNITVPSSSYTGPANNAAGNTSVWLMRPGFTTHAMNMGQRSMQLNNTFTVNSDGSFVLHVSPAPPNPNILQPGPVLVFVTVNGIPSNGTYAIVGNGQIGTQPTAPPQLLPSSATLSNVSGSGNSNGGNGDSGSSSDNATPSTASHTGIIIGGIVGAIAIVGIVGGLIGVCLAKRRRENQQPKSSSSGGVLGVGMRQPRPSDSSAFVPLQHNNESQAWNASSVSLTNPTGPGAPYRDMARGGTPSHDYDPYYEQPQQPSGRRY